MMRGPSEDPASNACTFLQHSRRSCRLRTGRWVKAVLLELPKYGGLV